MGLSTISWVSYSQNIYFNNVLVEPENTTLRNYNGSHIKEISVRAFDLSKENDTIGSIVTKDYFDEEFFETKQVVYVKG